MELTDTLGLINKSVRELSPYHLNPEQFETKLNQNENPFDWPEEIKSKVTAFCKEHPWNRYPNFVPEKLKEKIAIYTGIDPENIIVGNGSNEMLLILFISLLNQKSGLIISQPTFTVYSLLSRGLGSDVETVNLKPDLTFDTSEIKKKCDKYPGSVLVLCSPNNPTGLSLTEKDIRSILSVHKGFFILDQAYVEFGGFNSMELISEYPNLIITRTISKAFGGAGLRLGYLAGSREVVSEINKIKLPYNINFFSEHAAGVLLDNQEIMKGRIDEIITERNNLSVFLKTLPFDTIYPSNANFILVRINNSSDIFAYLKKRGILVRDVSSYPLLENCLRISVGTNVENNRIKTSLLDYFASTCTTNK